MDLWTIQSQLSYCHVVANLLIIIFNLFLFFSKTIQTPLRMWLYVWNKESNHNTYIQIIPSWRATEKPLLLLIPWKSPPSLIVFTQNLHQCTTMIKEMHLDIFLDNISSRIWCKWNILHWFKNGNIMWTHNYTKRKFTKKKTSLK